MEQTTPVAPTTPPPAPAANLASGQAAPSHEARRQRAIAILEAAGGEVSLPEPAKETAPQPEGSPDKPAAEPVAAKVEPSKEEPLAPRVKNLVERENHIKTREVEVDRKLAEAEAKEQAITELKDQPLKLLEKLGISFQQLADAVLEDSQTPDPQKAALRELNKKVDSLTKTLSDKEAAEKKAKEDAEIQAVEGKIAKYRGHLNQFLDEKKDTYELIHLAEAKDMVFEVIEEYFAQYGKLLEMNEAAQKVEAFLEHRISAGMKAKKFAPKEAVVGPKAPQTLSDGSTNGTASRANTGGSSDRERLARAAAMLQFE